GFGCAPRVGPIHPSRRAATSARPGLDMRVVVVSRFVGRTFGVQALVGLGALVMGGCASNSNAFRLNPEREPEEFRITCKQRFHFCESEAKEQCGGEYQVMSRYSNRPEQK